LNKDEEIRLEVIKELKLEPKISDPSHIKVAVKGGVVTLGGYVDHYMDRSTQKIAAERITGIQGLEQNITVELPADSQRDDLEIANSATNTLELISILPGATLKQWSRTGV